MKILEMTYSSPAENLACDEALLDGCETGTQGEILRFWAPKKYFIVLGYSNAWKEEAAFPGDVPILRRLSGGGTVLQGPGCLNYSLVLKIKPRTALEEIRSTNDFVMESHRKALEKLLQKKVAVQGFTDLTLENLKFSGNAQRRKRKALLFHGTFLLNFDLKMIEDCLKLPPKQPAYRLNRPHLSFVTNLKIDAEKVIQALAKTWGAKTKLEEIPEKKIKTLADERYSKDDWNLKF